MKVAAVGYFAVAMMTLFWQVYEHDFFSSCEFNVGACNVEIQRYSVNAAAWPKYLILWQEL
ncbi:MAG: hypothetical protein MI920_34490 [Kiloniellales bacterium]|nr:hypothetical protein [Kiloniellales bacterium]